MERDPAGSLKALLAGRYRIDRELGRGGFATVYQVWNPRLERSEALKVLAPGHQVDEDFSRRFTQEVRLAAGLEHPSIVKVYEFGQTEGIYWYSMQLVAGRTLADELEELGPLEEREAARVAIPLLEALEYSHSRGIVHRDIKPENVILDQEGRPFLMDFGIAKSAGSLVKTQTGFLLGTPAYVAPEQAQGKPLDGRTDLYALGVTLFKVASGSYPFEANDPLQAVVMRLTQPPRQFDEARKGADPVFSAIVMRALEREPANRWATARAMREAMTDYLAGRPVQGAAARFPGSTERSGPETAPPQSPRSYETVRTAEPPLPAAVGAPSQSARTSVLGKRSRRVSRLPAVAAVLALVAIAGTVALVLHFRGDPGAKRTEAAVPLRPPALEKPAPLSTPVPTSEPTASPVPAPTEAPIRVIRPTRAPDPEPPAAGRAVTAPEQLTPEPPFSGPPPAVCSGVAVSVILSVDAEGNVVRPRALPSNAPPECGKYVLEALPRWKWRPAVDGTGAAVVSRPLGVNIQLP